MNTELYKRIHEFEERVHKFLKTIPHSDDNVTIRTQLAKSASLAGVKYDEARSGSSINDLTEYCRIIPGASN